MQSKENELAIWNKVLFRVYDQFPYFTGKAVKESQLQHEGVVYHFLTQTNKDALKGISAL
jgi:hypothetical protein